MVKEEISCNVYFLPSNYWLLLSLQEKYFRIRTACYSRWKWYEIRQTFENGFDCTKYLGYIHYCTKSTESAT
ncbi:hypothetical protein IYO1511_c09820 [Lactiplantibacillus plantarum]|nr:hypothetical protein IYO1511_c09820 [Lactiplantibacillus plantarum]